MKSKLEIILGWLGGHDFVRRCMTVTICVISVLIVCFMGFGYLKIIDNKSDIDITIKGVTIKNPQKALMCKTND